MQEGGRAQHSSGGSSGRQPAAGRKQHLRRLGGNREHHLLHWRERGSEQRPRGRLAVRPRRRVRGRQESVAGAARQASPLQDASIPPHAHSSPRRGWDFDLVLGVALELAGLEVQAACHVKNECGAPAERRRDTATGNARMR